MDDPIDSLSARCEQLEARLLRQEELSGLLITALSLQCGRHDAACAALLGLLTLLGRQGQGLVSQEIEATYAGLLQTSTNAAHMTAFEESRTHIERAVRAYLLVDAEVH